MHVFRERLTAFLTTSQACEDPIAYRNIIIASGRVEELSFIKRWRGQGIKGETPANNIIAYNSACLGEVNLPFLNPEKY